MARRRHNGGPYGPYSGGDYGFGQYFVPILSRLTPNLFKAAHSTAGKIGPAPVPVGRIRRTTDSETLDLYGTGSDGAVDPNVVRQFNGWNLFGYTAAFTNAAWIKNGGTVTVSAADGQAGLSGSTASLITPAAGTGYAIVTQYSSAALVPGDTYTLKLDVKASGCDWIGVSGSTGFDSTIFQNVNLTNGSLGNGSLGTSTISVTSLGSGWYRIVFTGVCTSALASSRLIILPRKTNTVGRLTSDTFSGTDGILIDAPQFERASAFSTYEARSGVGAADSVWTHRYEQAEPIGRNLLTYSADLRNTSEAGSTRPWANSIVGTGVNVTGSSLVAGVSPLGYDATRLQFSLGGGTTTADLTRRVQSVTTTVGVQYVISFKIKSYDGASTYRMHLVSPTGATVNFDCTPEWTTVESTAVASSSSINFGMGLRGGQTPANSNTADVLVSEVQVEVATARSSYDHRTTRSSATRLDLIQPSSTLQPFVCQQGVPCVTSNGRLTSRHIAADARRMYISNSTEEFTELHTTGGTIGVVHQANDTALLKAIIATKPSTSNTAAGIVINRSDAERLQVFTSKIDIAGVSTSGDSIANSKATLTPTSLNIAVIVVDPDNATAAARATAWVNGTLLLDPNVSTGTPYVENAQGNLTVGAGTTGSISFDGDISETYLAGSLISDTDRETLQDHRGEFFGLTIA